MPRAAPPPGPYVRIVEQPASKALRFRYECEGRSAGSIPGVNSTNDKKTYPTIEVCGYVGPAIVVVSCVTKEEPFKPHPHNLVGRERCSRGVCTMKAEVTADNALLTFSNLGIQCVKRKDIADSLSTRQQQRIDPFRTGYEHKNQPQSIDLNAVRLCFQVFIQDRPGGTTRHSLRPVVTDIVFDKKAMSDLLIMRVSQCSGPSKGGTEMILLCEKVTREDTAVVFFQQEKEKVVWEAAANIILVHKQVAIAFTTPAYCNPRPPDLVEVYVQLKRISDNARSNAVPFTYIPDYTDSDYIAAKKRKLLRSSYEPESKLGYDPIKSEPRDRTPPHPSTMSPPLRYDQQYRDTDLYNQQWMQGNMNLPGSSHAPVTYGQEAVWGNPAYQVLSPQQQPLSPLHNLNPMQTLSPGMSMASPGQLSPAMAMTSPGHLSPGMAMASPGHLSPGMAMASPGHLSPGMAMTSPGHLSPAQIHEAMSPMDHNSPLPGNMVQQQNFVQLAPQLPQMMDTNTSDPPSFNNLLMNQGDVQYTSGDFTGFSFLSDRGNELSDSLTKLSTSELLQ